MIKREILKSNQQVKLTFIQPYDSSQARVSVVGDFNSWNPKTTPLIKRSNGTVSASVTLPAGQRIYFRYVTEQNHWFNDEAADAYEKGEHGTENCVVII